MESVALLYIPPAMTHLYGSNVHARLNRQQQVRYNHLCGLMAAEQFLAFEEVVIIRAIQRLARTPEVQSDPALAAALGEMIAEEAVHACWFRALLAEVEPALYADHKSCFTCLRWWERLALLPLVHTHDGALLMLWFTLLIEEHSLQLSRAMLADESPPLDKRFVGVHRRHLADEIRHLPLNVQLIERCFDPLPVWRRRLLAGLFRRLLRNIARPRRANTEVVRRLVSEFPVLANDLTELMSTVRDHFRNHAPRSDISHPEFHPSTMQALAERPEFSGVMADMKAGWGPRPISVGRRIILLILIEVTASGAYFAVSMIARWLTPHPNNVPSTVFDHWLPVVPEMVLAYQSLGLFILRSAWFSPERFQRLMHAGAVTTLIAYTCFLLLPLQLTRGQLPSDEPWRTFIGQLYAIDTPTNTMPSLHVAYVILILLAGGTTSGRWWVLGWGLLIIASTMLIGQHVVLDVLAGAALGGICWWWSGWYPCGPYIPRTKNPST